MNTKKCIIVHGCPSTPKDKSYNKHWIPWTKKELTIRSIDTKTPTMPSPWHPDYKKFKKKFSKYTIDKNTILIGHSCGCAFLVRWLGESKQRIFKLILVAPWKIPDKGDNYRYRFYTYSIDKTIKNRIGKIVMFTSDNEEKNGKKSLEIFHKSLGGEIIELKRKGHYTFEDMRTGEFPELIKVASE
jgi:predicted alpha/beta hydrolase family esterase